MLNEMERTKDVEIAAEHEKRIIAESSADMTAEGAARVVEKAAEERVSAGQAAGVYGGFDSHVGGSGEVRDFI